MGQDAMLLREGPSILSKVSKDIGELIPGIFRVSIIISRVHHPARSNGTPNAPHGVDKCNIRIASLQGLHGSDGILDISHQEKFSCSILQGQSP